MTGVFEVLAGDNFEERRNNRKAVAVANRRAHTRFAGFLSTAADKDDFEARLDLIDTDLQRVVGEVADEFEVAVDPVFSTVRQQLVAAGGFCDDCRKWKSGPKAGCTCHTENLDEDNGAPEEKTSSYPEYGFGGNATNAAPDGWPVDRTHAAPSIAPPGYGGQGQTCPDCGSPMQNGMCPNCGAKYASDNTGLADAPSPKMDKKRWKPNALNDEGNLKPIDTDGDSRWKTEQQDITQSADHTKDFLEQTDSVAKHNQDVEKEWSGDLLHTDTWSGTEGQADPVTSEHQSSVRTANQEVPTTWSQWGMHAGVHAPLTELNQACQALGGQLTINGQPYDQAAGELMAQGQGLAGQSVTVGAPHPVIAKGASYIIQTGADQGPDGAPISKKIVNAIVQQQQGGQAAPAQAPAPQQAMSAVDPDKNPIRDILESNYDGFIPTAEVDAAITAHRSKSE
jgi:hypothetical protein